MPRSSSSTYYASSSSSSNSGAKKHFSDNDFEEFLECFKRKLKEAGVTFPIRLVSNGGYVAVNEFGNRQSTMDLDCFVDPSLENDEGFQRMIDWAIKAVATEKNIQTHWMNNDFRVFTNKTSRQVEFNAAVQQNTVLHPKISKDPNSSSLVIIYAGRWAWQLKLKLRRISESESTTDVSDAICLLKKLDVQSESEIKYYVRNALAPNPANTKFNKVLNALGREWERNKSFYGKMPTD